MQTILVVDDKAENVYMMQALLQGSGFAVRAAGHGQEALAMARQTPPDLVIADILMPVMDGFNLCRQWKSDPGLSAIPFMFYTATYTDRKDEEFALKQGADLFLTKPCEPRDILSSVRSLLERATRRAAAKAAQPEPVYLKEYNEVLVRKLVAKVEELETRNRELARKEQMKSRFLQVAAHELYTPMTCVVCYADLLKQESASELLAKLRLAMEKLAAVTRTLIDMTREEADELPLTKVEVDLNALVTGLCADLRAFIDHRSQVLALDLCAQRLVATGDPDALGQAFTSLVLNAIRFTPDRGRITITTKAEAAGPAIAVSDTGIGIPEDERERIFERFYQVKDPMYHHSGTIEFLSGGLGLGLSIARAIAVKHGGAIELQSSVGQGSTFTLSLPNAV